MATKDYGREWTVREQIIEDPVSGLTFQFETLSNGSSVFRVFGESLSFGNREFYFDAEGHDAGSSTAVGGLCKPTWTYEVEA